MILIKVCKTIIQHDWWSEIRRNSKSDLTHILSESKRTLCLDGLPLRFRCARGIGTGEGSGDKIGGNRTEIVRVGCLCTVRVVNTNLLHLSENVSLALIQRVVVGEVFYLGRSVEQ